MINEETFLSPPLYLATITAVLYNTEVEERKYYCLFTAKQLLLEFFYHPLLLFFMVELLLAFHCKEECQSYLKVFIIPYNFIHQWKYQCHKMSQCVEGGVNLTTIASAGCLYWTNRKVCLKTWPSLSSLCLHHSTTGEYFSEKIPPWQKISFRGKLSVSPSAKFSIVTKMITCGWMTITIL